MNILKQYKESIKNVYKKQEILYRNIEHHNCDVNIINEFLLNYLKMIHKQNLQLDSSNLLDYKNVSEKNLQKRNKILEDIIQSIDFCKTIQEKNNKIKIYVKNIS